MKARQFCSVCKQWLDMEVVPTGDGDDDDGVIWFRCPQCQGFLPKLGGDLKAAVDQDDAVEEPAPAAGPKAGADAEDMPWDSPAAMMAARQSGDAGTAEDETLEDDGVDLESQLLEADDDADDDMDDHDDADDEDAAPEADDEGKDAAAAEPAEPVAEYAAMLAAVDASTATPYRPSGRYEVGQCIHHLAWEDCGVVVAHETLPGGRRVIKCWFESAGVVRLIVEAPE